MKGCVRGTGEKGLTPDEVVAVNEQVLEKAISQPDSALMMIERLRAGDFSVLDTTTASLQWSGPLPDYRCDYLRAKVYAQTLEGLWLDSAIIIGERLMTTDAAREDLAYRQNVLEMLINACRQHRDDEQTIRWSTEFIDIYRENDNETEILRTEAEIGLMLSGIGHADEGLAKIDSVLTLLSGKRKFNELDASIIALKRKVNVIKNILQTQQTHPRPEDFVRLRTKSPVREGSGYTQGQKNNDEQAEEVSTPLPHREGQGVGLIIAAAQQMLDLLADYEQHPDEFHDGTYREPPEHLRPGYIDFYRAQAYMFMTEAYAKVPQQTLPQPLPVREGSGYTQGQKTNDEQAEEVSTPLPHREGQGEGLQGEGLQGLQGLARHYLSLFESTDYAKTFAARKDFAPIYGLLGEYDKMLAIHDEQEARLRQQGDTVNVEFATILHDRAMAAEAQGRKDEALRLHKAYETLTATLNDRLLQGKANLYAARFHAIEQQHEIERHKATSRYLGIVGGCIAIAAVLAMFFAAYVVHKRRVVEQKNRSLVRQIAEAVEYKKKYEELEDAIQTPPVTPLFERRERTSAEESPLDGGKETEDSHQPIDADIFQHIHQVIREKKLYLDPQFNRQAASDYFQITTRRVGAAFSQGSEYAKITDFINQLRLDHARELMTVHSEMNIDEVATSSGFAVRRTFSRLFKEKFGLTPTEYRNIYLSEI